MARDADITSDEAAAVFRRAAELDQQGLVRGHLDVEALEQAGVEAGLSRQAIRRAVMELRTGALEVVPARRARWHMEPVVAVVGRTVPGTVSSVEDELARFFRQQAFEVRRQVEGRTVWAPADGLGASLRRSLGKLALKDVTRATVAVAGEPGDPRICHVRIELDFTRLRRGFLVLPWVGGFYGLGPAIPLSLTLAPVGLIAIAAVPVMAGGGYAIARVGYRGKRAGVIEAVEGMLDRLEHGIP